MIEFLICMFGIVVCYVVLLGGVLYVAKRWE